MASTSLKVFCSREELSQWLKILAEHFRLTFLVFRAGGVRGHAVRWSDFTSLPEDVSRLFLHPEGPEDFNRTKLEDVPSRALGWIDIRPGVLVRIEGESILTMTQIDAEDPDGENLNPSRFVKWLKRRIGNQITFGVVGHNVVTGGCSTYKIIGFTRDAEVMAEAGTRWKGTSTDRTRFLPG